MAKVYLYDTSVNKYTYIQIPSSDVKSYKMRRTGLWTGNVTEGHSVVLASEVTKLPRKSNIVLVFNDSTLSTTYTDTESITRGGTATYNRTTNQWDVTVHASWTSSSPIASTAYQEITANYQGAETQEELDFLSELIQWYSAAANPNFLGIPIFIDNGKLAIANTLICSFYHGGAVFLGYKGIGSECERMPLAVRALPYNNSYVFNIDNIDPENLNYGGMREFFAGPNAIFDRPPAYEDSHEFFERNGLEYPSGANEDESIYTPGGTSDDPHNPYSGGSGGLNPFTVDPLNSGSESDSLDTGGTWELPFDTVSLDHARVDSSQAGIYRLVGLTQQQLQIMADYMFSDASPSEAWENLMKLIYGNVVDTIIGIQEFPMDVCDSVGTDIFCFIGRTPSTGMFVGKNLTSEYRSLDFGTIEVPRYSGTFYDFEPYTTLTLYIPYIGYIDMKPTEVVGSILYINGWVHLSTGEVTINVRSSRTGILGSYSGNIGRSLPISSADCTRLYAAIIETAAGIGGYASFGASASAMGGIEHADPHNMNVARGQYAQAVRAYGSAKKGVRGAQANMLEKQAAYEQAKEEFSSAKTAERQEVQAAERAEREFNEAGLEAYSNAIDAVTSGFEVVRGTHMTPGAGRTSPQVCFLRIEVPHQNVSKNQKLLGYPCNSAEVLNSDKLHGYTELRMIDLQIPGISLTELQELESILKGGFYLP